MSYQTIFKRYEMKYMLTKEQKEAVLLAMVPYMKIDKYGRTTIRNIYFDTDSYRLIRHSIEKPVYKEKLRIRSYKQTKAEDTVFIELKKKYDSVVYKRRIALPQAQVMDFINKGEHLHQRSQISDEINYFCDYYGTLHPAVFLSYEREAYYSLDKSDFRVTFDDNILCRTEKLSLSEDIYGTPLLEEGQVLMEIKTSGAVPLWMAHCLAENKIYKTSFSKYGTAYQKILHNNYKGEQIYA